MVVLPAPVRPMRPIISPLPSVIDMPSTARKPPNCLTSARASTRGLAVASVPSKLASLVRGFMSISADV